MIVSHTTPEGFTLTVYCGGYSDSWGLQIIKDEEVLFDSNCFLSCQDYGFAEGELEIAPSVYNVEPVEWDEQTWLEVLADEAETLLDAAIGEL